jgi:hypothetical protein
VVALKVTDIDSQRMTMRIEQGKGRRDRYAMLSPVLLERLRVWWHVARAQGKMLDGGRVFPGLDPVDPLSTRQLNRAIHAAAEAAHIDKRVSVVPPCSSHIRHRVRRCANTRSPMGHRINQPSLLLFPNSFRTPRAKPQELHCCLSRPVVLDHFRRVSSRSRRTPKVCVDQPMPEGHLCPRSSDVHQASEEPIRHASKIAPIALLASWPSLRTFMFVFAFSGSPFASGWRMKLFG